MDYIVKYTKVPFTNKYYIICSDKSTYICDIEGYEGLYFLNFRGYINDFLFRKFNISKNYLYYKVFKRRDEDGGFWPYCKTKKECITLLKALIKETQVRYYADTEL